MVTDQFNTRILIITCVLVWVVCAINPHEFEAWALEQVASIICLSFLFWTRHRIQFSIAAKTGIAVVFIVHTIGTHFTYSLTPYDQFSQTFLHFSIDEFLGWQRNNYDRFVHLVYGICLTLPLAELFTKLQKVTMGNSLFLAFNIILSTSAGYELLEWLGAVLFGGDLGMLYLGTQGDVWDAQADIAYAGTGSLIAIGYHYAHFWTRKLYTK